MFYAWRSTLISTRPAIADDAFHPGLPLESPAALLPPVDAAVGTIVCPSIVAPAPAPAELEDAEVPAPAALVVALVDPVLSAPDVVESCERVTLLVSFPVALQTP